MRPGSLHSRSAEENCPTENVSSRPSVKVATPPCDAKAAIPCGLAVRKQHKMLFAASKFDINKSKFVEDIKMAQVIWDGNKNWENVWDGKKPWDREIEEKSIPENAVLIDRPDDIIKASIPYMIIPCIVCFVAIFTKKAQSDEFIFNLWFMPLSFIIGFFVAMPLHEFLHAIGYPKGAKVYIGVSLKQLRAYAASSAALSRGRYIMMSLAPLIPGIIFLAVFVVCPISMKWLMTICVVPSFMGLISPAPDYMDVLIILRKVPKGAMIQATENGLVWYL